MTFKATSAFIACVCLFGVGAAPAQAESVTFAQFFQTVKSSKIFSYTDLGAASTLTSSSQAPQTVFTPSQLPPISFFGLLDPEDTIFNMSATATGSAVLSGGLFSQTFDGSLSFTLPTAKLGLSGLSTNALTVTFTNAVLYGQNGTRAPTLTADAALLGSSISYSSGFADLADVGEKNFSLSFSGSSLPLLFFNLSHLPSARLSGSGTFAASAVPEPATWAFMLSGLGAVGLTMRSRRGRVAFS